MWDSATGLAEMVLVAPPIDIHHLAAAHHPGGRETTTTN